MLLSPAYAAESGTSDSSANAAVTTVAEARSVKLVSAVIVAVAIAAPNMKDYVHLAKIKSNARKLRALSGKGDEIDA